MTHGLDVGWVRAALKDFSGHATRLRAFQETQRSLDVFEPPTPALHGLTASIKESVDPDHILKPGRMYAGI